MAVDEQQNIVGQQISGSTNLTSNSEEVVFNNLKELFLNFFTYSKTEIDNCLGICIGSAGVDYESNRQLLERFLIRIGFTCPTLIVNDGLLVLASETKGKQGIVIISGTGSIAFGIDSAGNIVRSGGWGHLLDDQGSGYWIGKQGLICALRSYDGRGEKSSLEDLLSKALDVQNLPDCIEKIYSGEFNKSDMATLSIIVEHGAFQGDKVCIDILKGAAFGLYELAHSVMKNIPQKDCLTVIVSGGNILKKNLLFKMFKEVMYLKLPRVRIVKASHEPVMGAVYLAIKNINRESDNQILTNEQYELFYNNPIEKR